MINSVSSTNLLQNYAVKPAEQPKAEETKGAEQPEIAQDIVKKETADATKAYAAGIIAPPPKQAPENKSLDELKADLVAQGKVEGKDFKIEKKEDKQGVYGHELVVLENDKPVKSYYFDNIDKEKEELQFITDYSYPADLPTLANDDKSPKLKSMETSYGADGEFHFRTTRYERENSPYKDDIVNYDTKPFELENKLEAEGIKFARDIDYSTDNENSNTFMVNKITTFDPKTNDVTRYEFTYNKADDSVVDVTKSMIGNDGSIKSNIVFKKDETAFVNFEDDLKA